MLTLHKVSGTGNSFLLVDLRPIRALRIPRIAKGRRRKLARELCNVYHSIGADGLLFIENSRRADLQWDFYNADGSSAEMCGNAARCVGVYLKTIQKGRHQPVKVSILTRAGLVQVAESGPSFSVEMPAIKEIEVGRSFDFVNSGVPHAVVEILGGRKPLGENVENLEDIVDKIRSERRFKKNGVNVTFYRRANRTANRIESLTFERGVPGYTQACGTGAVAAAVSFAARKALQKGSIAVVVPGGRLTVQLGGPSPVLIGPALYIGQIQTP